MWAKKMLTWSEENAHMIGRKKMLALERMLAM